MSRKPLPDARCFFGSEGIVYGRLKLPKAEAHHLISVRRKKVGDELALLSGDGVIGYARVSGVEGRHVEVDVHDMQVVEKPEVRIGLAVAALKPNAMELVLQKAVELGAHRVVVFGSDHAVAKFDPGKLEKKTERWRQQMIEACKQSGNPWLPELVVVPNLSTALDQFPGDALHLAAILSPEASAIPAVLPERLPQTLGLWIGPEGDFSAAEIESLQTAGAKAVSLGPNILRAETAAMSLLAIVQSSLDGKGFPTVGIAG